MSKLSFRARALDASKPMPVYEAEDIPDLPDFAAINRAVPQMPTGMEKEEESEHHLQRALSAQQVYGTSEVLVIPIPEIDAANEVHHDKLYTSDYKQPKQYIHVQAFSMDQEIPDYDMDSEDENWLQKQVKKMEVTPLQFEEMMDRLEKGSGQQVVTLQEAKLLLKEDDDLIIAVYDYWLNKRLRMQHPLIPTVKTEKRDGSTTNNPYVAFRRRTEKMQTRKNRKNDETSYEKMLKLRRDLSRAVTLLEMIKRREKTKKELLQLTIEIVEKRYQVQDFNGTLLAEALAQRHKIPSFIPVNQFAPGREWARKKSEDNGYVRKKREYKKRKHKQATAVPSASTQPTPQLPQYNEVDVLHTDAYSSDDEAISPAMSPSDHEDENDPDGIYAFRRKKGCSYLAPVTDTLGNWPWSSPEEGGAGDPRYRYVLTSLTTPRRCIGFARRRVGRGGRIILDRAHTEWDDCLTDLDLSSSSSYSGDYSDFVSHIRDNNWLHFRPRTPPIDEPPQPGTLSPPLEMVTEFNIESFQNHQEQLLQMQREQQEQMLRYQTTDLDSSVDLEHSFSSQPTSRFTLDAATAQFAASAVVNSSVQVAAETVPLVSVGATQLTHTSSTATLANGPINNDNKSNVFSTSPAATVLQLNYPICSGTTGSQSSVSSSSTTTTTTSSLSLSAASTVVMATTSSTSSSSQPIPVVNTSCSLPSLLKIPAKNSSTTIQVPLENHDSSSPVNSIVKDNSAVPMEVT